MNTESSEVTKKKKKKKQAMSRSENMSRIKGKNSTPEVYIRKLLWHKGFRYRKNYSNLPGKPDIYLKKYNTAIFVNGCFWHMHSGCKYSTMPSSHIEYWKNKLLNNVERDKKEYALLKNDGIKVLVIWECTIKKMKKDHVMESEVLNKIISFLADKTDNKFLEL